MLFASFKENNAIFGDPLNIIPQTFRANGYVYVNGWIGVGKYTFGTYLANSFILTIPTVLWPNVLSMSIVSIVPSTIIYLFLQKYFVEGIATSGLKG